MTEVTVTISTFLDQITTRLSKNSIPDRSYKPAINLLNAKASKNILKCCSKKLHGRIGELNQGIDKQEVTMIKDAHFGLERDIMEFLARRIAD